MTENISIKNLDNAIFLAGRLVESLPYGLPRLFNPWKERCAYDFAGNGPNERLERLAKHLNCDPLFILVGEAPGYQGCRYSGIAFTSEKLLLQGEIPRIPALTKRLSSRKIPFSEPSATIVWRTLINLGIENRTILWNALQLHPHNDNKPLSNRTPTSSELAHGAISLSLLIAAFPSAKIVAVGKKAQSLMKSQGISPIATIRHPANGGAKAFAAELEALVK